MIPRNVYQIYLSGVLPEKLSFSREVMQNENPDWKFHLFDKDDIYSFVGMKFGRGMVAEIDKIRPEYAAARVDLLRYLLIYATGGVYLDIKSRFVGRISSKILPDDEYILAQWRNGIDAEHAGFGLHRDLRNVPGGEFQQWHVIARPSHPFLAAVIDLVLRNIREYSTWSFGVGRIGVQRVTGPIAYTKAIYPLLAAHKHRQLRNEQEIGLCYSIGDGYNHISHFKNHYSLSAKPIIHLSKSRMMSAHVYAGLRRVKDALRYLR